MHGPVALELLGNCFQFAFSLNFLSSYQAQYVSCLLVQS